MKLCLGGHENNTFSRVILDYIYTNNSVAENKNLKKEVV